MALLDLFRKAHKHSDPAVRMDAVRQLPEADATLLAAIAQEDPDASVRRAALKKLHDPALLDALARVETDEANRRLAVERVVRHFVGVAVAGDEAAAREALPRITEPADLSRVAREAALPDVALEALGRLPEGKALGDVARHAASPEIRRAAIDRIAHPGALAQVAMHDAVEELALHALSRVEDPDTLRRLAASAPRKSVRRGAAEVLEKRGLPVEGPSKQRRAAQLALVNEVESLRGSFTSDVAAARVAAAATTWQELGTDAVTELQNRFGRAVEVFGAAREDFVKSRPAAAEAAPDDTAERLHLCERVEALEGEAIGAGLEEAAAAWGRLPAAPQELARRFERAVRDARRRAEAELGRADRRAKLEAVLVEAVEAVAVADVREARRRIETCGKFFRAAAGGFPVDPDLEERWGAIDEQLSVRRAEEAEQAQARAALQVAGLEALCARLEHAPEGKEETRDLGALAGEGREAMRRLGGFEARERRKWRDRLEAGVKHVESRIQDLRDGRQWHQWIAEPVLEELCKRVEALLEEPDIPKANHELPLLRAAWNERAGLATGKLREFAHRFNKAAAQVRTRCDAHFAELDTVRKANMERKVALAVQAEELASSTDWRETTEVIKRIQAEWKEIGEVPRKHGQALWERFHKACDTFFQRKKEHFSEQNEERTKNLALKKELVARAEELQSSMDWDNTADELKRLQVKWKAIGPSMESEQVWHQFRSACDRFFERRSRRHEVEREERDTRLEEKVKAVEALAALEAEAEAPEGFAATVVAAWNEVRGLSRLEPRVRAALDGLLGSRAAAFAGTDLDPTVTRRRREDICRKVEGLKPPEVVALPKNASLDQMVAQLRTALRTGPPKEDPRRATTRFTQDLARLEDAWRGLPPLPGEDAAALETRFRAACDAARSRLQPQAH